MKFLKLIFGVLLIGAALNSVAQNTIVSATVVDSDSTTWANGTWQVSFIPNPNFPSLGQYTFGGAPLAASVIAQTGSLNGSGVLSITLYDSTQITPQGSQWKLQMCPNASAPCGTYNFATAGSTQNISSGLNAGIPAPRFNAVSGSYGYVDAEAIMTIPVGGTYYNVGSSCQRLWNGSAWACLAGSGTVTSVGVSAPSYLTVAGSPVTGAGTIAISGTSEPANEVLAAPNGSAGALAPRLLTSADIPSTIASNTSGTAANLSGTPALPNGTTATTQTVGDNTLKVATDAFVIMNAGSGGGGISGATVNQHVVATGATTGTSSPNPIVITSNTTGSDFCAKLATGISQISGSHSIIDATGFTGVQACGSNPLSGIASGASSIEIRMPCQIINTTVPWIYTAGNGVHIIGCGEDGNSVLQATTGYTPVTSPLITFGTTAGVNSYNYLENWRLNANSLLTGTIYACLGCQEGSGARHVNFQGGNSASTTADAVICTNCDNSFWEDFVVSKAGLNHGLTFNTTGSASYESNIILKGTVNNTGSNSGLGGGLFFAGTSFMSWSDFFVVHSEGFPYGVEVGANGHISGHELDTTGSITVSTLRIDTGGTAGGVMVTGITDGGAATNLVDDESPSTPVLITTSANPFGSHSGIINYPILGSGSGSIGGSATIGFLPKMVTNTTTIGSSLCDEGITTANTFTCTDTAGAVFGGPVTAGGTTGNAAVLELPGNTTAPATIANSFGIVGPNSASFTGFHWQAPTATNGSAGIIHVAANVSGLSQLSVSPISLTADVSGLLSVANGGTGTASPGIVAGTNVTVSGTWPNQTVNSSGSGGGLPTGTTGQTVYYAAGGTTGTATSAITINSASAGSTIGLNGNPINTYAYPATNPTISGSCTSALTTCTLSSITGIPTTGGVLLFGGDGGGTQEFVLYTGVSGATITGMTRGYEGTTAATQPNGTKVEVVTEQGFTSASTLPLWFTLSNIGTFYGADAGHINNADFNSPNPLFYAQMFVSPDYSFGSGNPQMTLSSGNFSLQTSGGTVFGLVSNTTGSVGLAQFPGYESAKGTKFTASGCTNGTTLGGSSAGKMTLGANTCTVTITMGGATVLTANTGWSCHANDETTAAGNTGLYFSANTTTTATLTVPATAGTTDVIDFSCEAF